MSMSIDPRIDMRTGPAQPTSRPVPPPQERPTALIDPARYTSA